VVRPRLYSAERRLWPIPVLDTLNRPLGIVTHVEPIMMKKRISILCPVRGNTKLTAGLIDNIARTSTHLDRVELLFYFDEDDDELPRLKNLVSLTNKHWPQMLCTAVVGPRMGINIAFNKLGKIANGDIINIANDGMRYTAPGWDTSIDRIAETYPDGIYCCAFFFNRPSFANKLRNSTRGLPLFPFPFITREWMNIVGYCTPVSFEHCCNEMWPNEIAFRINRMVWLKDNFITHTNEPILNRTQTQERANRDLIRFHALWRYRVSDARLLLEQIVEFDHSQANAVRMILESPDFVMPKILDKQPRLI
jgi:hypothetical protein